MRRVLLFLSFFILIAMLFGATAERGPGAFNIEWIYFGMWIFLLALFGVVSWFIMAHGIPVAPRKRKSMGKRDILMLILTVAALIFAINRLLSEKPELEKPAPGPKLRYPEINLFNFSSSLKIFYSPFQWYLYALPLVILVILLLHFRKRHRVDEELPIFEPELTFDSIEGTEDERVIKMYKNLVAGLIKKGYPYQKSWTHWEHEEHLKNIFEDLQDLHTLTAIFEKAKYGKKLSEGDVKKARESYEKLIQFLR